MGGQLRLEPAFELHRRHLGLADHRELVGQDVFFLVRVSAEHHERGNLQAASRKLRSFAHGRSLLEHVAPRFGVQHHRFVDFRSRSLASWVKVRCLLTRGIHLDVVLADPDRIAVMQGGAFHPQVVDESSVQAVEVFHHQTSGLEINSGVIIRHREVVHRQIVVR